MNLKLKYFLKSQNISTDLKGPKVKYKLHYGRCTGRFLGLPHGTTPAAVTTNKNVKMNSKAFKLIFGQLVPFSIFISNKIQVTCKSNPLRLIIAETNDISKRIAIIVIRTYIVLLTKLMKLFLLLRILYWETNRQRVKLLKLGTTKLSDLRNMHMN